jgi:quinol monooxygenase YgiN
MSTLVTNELFAQPGHGDDVANLLIEILDESLQHEGCETIRIVRDRDDPDHVAGFTQWTERRNFEDYLAWRTERGFTGTFEAMLTRPFVNHYYDIAYFGEGGAPEHSTLAHEAASAALPKAAAWPRGSGIPPPKPGMCGAGINGSLSLSGSGSGFESGEYEVVQGAGPGLPVGCGVDLPQARQGEDDVVWIKSGADDARPLGGS